MDLDLKNITVVLHLQKRDMGNWQPPRCRMFEGRHRPKPCETCGRGGLLTGPNSRRASSSRSSETEQYYVVFWLLNASCQCLQNFLTLIATWQSVTVEQKNKM